MKRFAIAALGLVLAVGAVNGFTAHAKTFQPTVNSDIPPVCTPIYCP